MKGLISIAASITGLFIEDGALALAILGVVTAAGLCVALIPKAAASGAILLFGCLGVLLLSAFQARRR